MKTLDNAFKNVARGVGLTVTGIGLCGLLNYCAKPHISNSLPVEKAKSEQKSNYFEKGMPWENVRYIFKQEDGELYGINDDYTKVDEDLKKREWNEDYQFKFEAIREEDAEIPICPFTKTKDLNPKRKNNHFKYDLDEYTEIVKLGKITYRVFKTNNKMSLFDVKKTKPILNEEDDQVYIRNKPGQEGILVADLPENEKKDNSTYSTSRDRDTYQTNDKSQKSWNRNTQPDDNKNYFTITIRDGDTLHDIAFKFRISVKELQERNPGVDPRNLKIGSRLRIRELDK